MAEVESGIRIEIINNVLLITFARPAALNAINDAGYLAIAGALNSAARDHSVYAAIITGEGKYFCAGTDLKDGLAHMEERKRMRSWDAPVGRYVEAVITFPKLLVAAVNGNAVGIGMTLLPHCDAVFICPTAAMWVPFAKLALVPEFASSLLFRELFGNAMAMDILLAGRKVTAQDAMAFKLATHLVESPTHALPAAQEYCASILRQPSGPVSVLMYKRLAQRHHYIRAICIDEFDALDQRIRGNAVSVESMVKL